MVRPAAGSAGAARARDERSPAARRALRSGARPPAARSRLAGQVVVISGLSGAGKSQASKLFEDLGYYCVDNLPPDLLEGFLELRDEEPERYRDAALVLDIRAGDPAPAIRRARAALAERGVQLRVLFLEANDANLVSRYSETRHRHPLQSRSGVQAGIIEERSRLARTRELADNVIDTSGCSIGQLKERLFSLVPRDGLNDVLQVDVLTFGFKFGIPLEADLVFDVRFLTNPYYVADLKPLSGLQQPVRDYVLGQPSAGRFLDLVIELLELTVPAYRHEGKSRLTVALGCTGGYHRSIALAEELAQRLRAQGGVNVAVFHRELER